MHVSYSDNEKKELGLIESLCERSRYFIPHTSCTWDCMAAYRIKNIMYKKPDLTTSYRRIREHVET